MSEVHRVVEWNNEFGFQMSTAYVKGSLTLTDGTAHPWLVLSRVCVPDGAPTGGAMEQAENALRGELARDKHPALTSARLRGGAGCGALMAKIKEALRAQL